MTYGDLKYRLTKAFPGVAIDLIEGWISDRYSEILGELPWQRLKVSSILVTAEPYVTGTVQVEKGSTVVALTGGSWSDALNGRAFRVTGRDEFYELTITGAAAIALDRPYEGDTAAAANYTIFQHIYPLPANCRLLQDDAFSSVYGEMTRLSHGQLNSIDPWRRLTGKAQCWASYMDDSSTPPNMQVEIYPCPDHAVGIPFTYFTDAESLNDDSLTFRVWMQPTALIEGVTAKIKRHLQDYSGAQLATADASMALKNMRTSEAQGMGPARMRLDNYYTRHRARRCR